MDEIDYHCLQNFQSSYDKFYHELDPHNFSILNPNLFYLEKSTPSPYYEKQKTHCISQKHSSPVFNEIFCINNPNENDKNQKIEENNTNSSKNLNNQIQSNLIESQSCNYSLKENENSGDSNLNEFHSGRWSKDEHEKFIEGILKYGNEWKKVQNVIKTRSSTQARSHAQKYFLRLKKEASPDILCDQDKLFQYIINSNNNIKNSLELTNEQKEKLIAVIKSNIKSEENNLNKTDKEGNNSNINEKDDSGFDDLNEEEDNLAYYKDIKDENLGLQKKMSCDVEDNKRKVTFCSRKRKSSSDMTFLSNSYNKIFTITKDVNHKHSVDITKSNNIFINNLSLKNSAEKKNNNIYQNKTSNINISSNNINKKFNVNNEQNIKINRNNSKINANNNNTNNNLKNNSIYQKKESLNSQGGMNNYNFNNARFIITNNFYNIYQLNNDGISMNNISKNNYISNNSYINNPPNKFNITIKEDSNIKTSDMNTLSKSNKNQNNIDNNNIINQNINEKDKNDDINKFFFNNNNFFPKSLYQDNYNNNEQNDPFNLRFEVFSSNNNKNNGIYLENYMGSSDNIDVNNHTLSEYPNNFINEN